MAKTSTSRTGANKDGQGHQRVFATGMFFVLGGVLAIIVALYVEETCYLSTLGGISLKLLEHLGIAAIVLGLVGVIIEFRDWQEYFQERLAAIVVDRKYLLTLHPNQLIELQTDTLKAYFRNDEIDRKDSFLDFFQTKIQTFIGSPYKESTQHIISINLSEDGQSYIVEETISARNRKVRGSIPERVSWTTFKETHIQLKEFTIVVEVPGNFYQSPDFKSRYPDMGSPQQTYKAETMEGKLVPKKAETIEGKLVPKDECLIAAEEGQGFYFPLNKYEGIDNLYTQVNLKYTLPINIPFSWSAVHPHKGLGLVVTYPPSLEMDLGIFGVDENEYHKEDRVGLYTFEYNSWLLPDSGYSFNLRQRMPSTPGADPPSGLPPPAARELTEAEARAERRPIRE